VTADRAAILSTLAILALAGLLLALAGCTDPPSPGRQTPPAAAEVGDLSARRAAAELAHAEALARGDAVEAEYQRRLAEALRPLLVDAETRQQAQQAELDRRAAVDQAQARQAAEAAQLAKDRRWSMIGIAGCAAVLVALLVLGLPPLLAVGLPAAAATGLAVLAGLSSVPWLATAIGLAIACLVLVGLAGLAVYVAREWRRHADDTDLLGRTSADAASLARQPRPLRWLVSRLLGVA
jgi:hypothetical protein